MFSWKRGLAGFVCIALLLGSMPFVLAATTNRNYNENIGINFEAPMQPVTPFSTKSIEVTNARLTSNAPTVFSSSIEGWTIDQKTALGGALNLSQFSKFKTDNRLGDLSFLTSAPMSIGTNNNVFVLTNRTEAAKTRASFIGPAIQFEANSYYMVSVDYYATESFGAFYLVPSQDTPLDKNISPRIDLPRTTSWRTAQFFVKTDLLASHTFSMTMNLGNVTESAGAIYFQNPRIDMLSLEAFTLQKTKANTQSNLLTMEVDLADEDFVYNNKKITETHDLTFERNVIDPKHAANPELFGTVSRTSIPSSSVPTLLNLEDVNRVHLAKSSGVGNVMLLATTNMQASLKLKAPFTIKRHQIYMISFYTLVSNGTSSTIRIRENGWANMKADEYFDTQHRSINITGNPDLNGWALNTYFVTGETYYDIPVDIELWVGTQENRATDFMVIDGFNIQRISHEYFTNYGQTQTENHYSMDTNQTADIANAFFNLGTIRNVDSPYPLKANDWNHVFDEQDKDLVLSGIVNTEEKHWAEYANAGAGKQSNYGIAGIRPSIVNGTSPNNNVYMMQNRGTTWQTLTSPSIRLGSGVTNVISFDLMRQHFPNQGLNFWVSAHVKNREIARINLGYDPRSGGNLVSTGWEKYSFAITESAISNREVTLKFNLGSNARGERTSVAGIVFLDNIRVVQTDRAQDIPSNAEKMDLNNTMEFFTTSDAQAFVGVYSNTLQFVNNNRTQSTSMANTLTENIGGGSFYEYKMRIKIENLNAYHLCKPGTPSSNNIKDNTGIKIDCKLADHDWGVNVKLDGFEGGFEHLRPADIRDMDVVDGNGFAEIVFYIRPDSSDDLALRVTFGSQEVAVTGNVFIRDISLKAIDEDEFKEARTKFTDSTHVAFITESYSESDEKAKGERVPIEWWIVVPSIIMAVAVLVALIGFLLKKDIFRRHINKKHTSYASDDRRARK